MPCELSWLGRQRTGFCQFGPRGGPFDVSISSLTLFPDADDSHGHRGGDEDDQDVTGGSFEWRRQCYPFQE